LSYLAKSLGLFIAYFVTARLGLLLGAVSGFATLVWAPTGIALFALYTHGRRLWPAVFAGALLVNLLTGASLSVAIGIGAGNTLEALLAVLLLERAGFHPSLTRVADVLLLLALGAVASTLSSAVLGITSLSVGHIVRPSQAWPTFRAWWLGDSLGDITVAPLLWVCSRLETLRALLRRMREAATLTLAVTVSCGLVFWGLVPGVEQTPLGEAYVLFPVMIWAGVRFGLPGSVLSNFCISALAIAGTTTGHGPFSRPSLSESLLVLQGFMFIASAAGLILGAAISERDLASEKARDAIRARDDLISIVGHELRTPLTSLSLQILSLKKEVGSQDADVRPRVGGIERQVRRIVLLVDNLVDVSRIVAGKISLQREPSDLRAIVDEAVERLGAEAAKAGSQLTVVGDSNLQGQWDVMRMDQVVTNLVSNSLKYGRGKPVEITVRATESGIDLTVLDHGIGIPEDAQRRIFERFERAVSGRHFGGLGLGLWIVKQIVTEMGGSIAVHSAPDQGSEFRVHLPQP
jgi:signal transduction histidine kinase